MERIKIRWSGNSDDAQMLPPSGFHEEGLGGGSAAYMRQLPDHHILVGDDDGNLPTYEDVVVVGLYRGSAEDIDESGSVGEDDVEYDTFILDEDDPDARDRAVGDFLTSLIVEYG